MGTSAKRMRFDPVEEDEGGSAPKAPPLTAPDTAGLPLYWPGGMTVDRLGDQAVIAVGPCGHVLACNTAVVSSDVPCKDCLASAKHCWISRGDRTASVLPMLEPRQDEVAPCHSTVSAETRSLQTNVSGPNVSSPLPMVPFTWKQPPSSHRSAFCPPDPRVHIGSKTIM
jgi:hypothetical protein